MDDMMYELFGEMERVMNARPDRDVTYRYKIYRRPDLSHPVILRVRDYEREVLGSRDQLAGPCRLLDQDDWNVLVSNVFEKKYPELLRLEAQGLLDDCISTLAVKLNDQKGLIIESVKGENLGKEQEAYRIRDWTTEEAMALVPDYPDSDGEEYEDQLMPDLVKSCQRKNLTDGETKALCREKRYIVPLPEEIDWMFLRDEAGMPLLSDAAGGSEEQDPEAADIRRLVALIMQAEYCRAMRAESSDDDGPSLLDEYGDPLDDDETELIEESGRIAWSELRRRICLAHAVKSPEMKEQADKLIGNLLRSPGKQKEPFSSLGRIINFWKMNLGKANPARKVSAFAESGRETLLEDLRMANADRISSDNAMRLLEEAAEGQTNALTGIGNLYYAGVGVAQDFGKAARWYKAAASLEHCGAQFMLGEMYRMGQGVSQDEKEASLWYGKAAGPFLKAAEQGDPYFQYRIGNMYIYGRGVDQSDQEAEKWYRKAAEQGNMAAQHGLALYYNATRYRDPIESAKWMLKAAEQGDLYCQRWAGERYLKGEGVDKDEREASRWYRRAAEQGDAESQKILGDMYRYGKGPDRDAVAAEAWYRKAAEGGSDKAKECLDFLTLSRKAEQADSSEAFRLACMYESGTGTEKDYGMAMKLYLKAASEGSADAMLYLGLIYDHSLCGAEENKEEAAGWYRKALESSEEAAGKGSADAQYRIGIMCRDGLGTGVNLPAAGRWLRLAAEQHHERAVEALANMFFSEPDGLREDADEGDSEAQCLLGNICCFGVRDYQAALEWYLKAAGQGDAYGEYCTGCMYRHGLGVPEDKEKAEAWFRKAAAHGSAEAADALRDLPPDGLDDLDNEDVPF